MVLGAAHHVNKRPPSDRPDTRQTVCRRMAELKGRPMTGTVVITCPVSPNTVGTRH